MAKEMEDQIAIISFKVRGHLWSTFALSYEFAFSKCIKKTKTHKTKTHNY